MACWRRSWRTEEARASAAAGPDTRIGTTSVSTKAPSQRKRGRDESRLVFVFTIGRDPSGGAPMGAIGAPRGTFPAMSKRTERPLQSGVSADDWRIEHDSMGEVRVPASAKWAAQ